MRKKSAFSCLLSLFIIISFSSIKAQDSAAMVKDSMYWYIEASVPNPSGNGDIDYYFSSYWLAGDSVLNGKNYYKMCTYPDGVIGLIREESQRVYYTAFRNGVADTTETLAYDFNLVEGDTFRLYTRNKYTTEPDTVIYLVRDTSYTTLATGERKKVLVLECLYSNDEIYTDRVEGQRWIEGVGSLSHPLYFLGNVPLFEVYVGVNCVLLKRKELYHYSGQCYYTFMNIDKREMPASKVLIYPDPVGNYLNIGASPFGNGIQSANIFDLSGHKVLSIAQPVFPINVSILPQGLYLIQLSTQNGICNGKFMKQ